MGKRQGDPYKHNVPVRTSFGWMFIGPILLGGYPLFHFNNIFIAIEPKWMEGSNS
jgi:hypothetical protein